jgi:2-amino-4-hydroxy-6-hydroxymethyldihydropteridine diphosphokinase
MSMHCVWIGLGTNLGDRAANLAAAIGGLSRLITHTALSGVYESGPFGYTEQPDFLNMVVRGHATLEPRTLLAALKELENELGRTPNFRMGPRIIDLDLLLYGDVVLDAPDLSLPHPGITDRAFVLAPLLELNASLHDPRTGVALAAMYAQTLPGTVLRLGSAADVLPLPPRTGANEA